MAIVINGSGTVTGLSVGGLPDGTVDADTVAADVATQAELDAKTDATKLPLAGGTMTGHTLHADAVYSRWGAGNDLRIGHENNNSYIQDVGSGDLIITTDGANISLQKGSSEYMARFFPDGSNEFYHNNVSTITLMEIGA